jgi:hypothetical protein
MLSSQIACGFWKKKLLMGGSRSLTAVPQTFRGQGAPRSGRSGMPCRGYARGRWDGANGGRCRATERQLKPSDMSDVLFSSRLTERGYTVISQLRRGVARRYLSPMRSSSATASERRTRNSDLRTGGDFAERPNPVYPSGCVSHRAAGGLAPAASPVCQPGPLLLRQPLNAPPRVAPWKMYLK